MHYFLFMYFNVKSLHVSSRLAAHHHDYTNCRLYRVDPPDDEQQACSKHIIEINEQKIVHLVGSYYTVYTITLCSLHVPTCSVW